MEDAQRKNTQHDNVPEELNDEELDDVSGGKKSIQGKKYCQRCGVLLDSGTRANWCLSCSTTLTA